MQCPRCLNTDKALLSNSIRTLLLILSFIDDKIAFIISRMDDII